jgi:hypothetical protein
MIAALAFLAASFTPEGCGAVLNIPENCVMRLGRTLHNGETFCFEVDRQKPSDPPGTQPLGKWASGLNIARPFTLSLRLCTLSPNARAFGTTAVVGYQ